MDNYKNLSMYALVDKHSIKVIGIYPYFEAQDKLKQMTEFNCINLNRYEIQGPFNVSNYQKQNIFSQPKLESIDENDYFKFHK